MRAKLKNVFSSLGFISLALSIFLLVLGRPAAQPVGGPLGQLDARLAALEASVEALIPCTPDRYRANLCAPNDTPFDLVVNLCASAGGQASLEGKFALDSKTSVEGGIGWKDGPDLGLKVEAGIPGVAAIPIVLPPPAPPVGVPIILPSEVAVGAGAAVGLGLDGCLQATKVPVGQILTRDQILAMLNLIEAGQNDLVAALASAISPAPSVQTAALQTQQATLPHFDTATLVQAVNAAQTFASTKFGANTGQPLVDLFSSSEVSALRSSLPVGDRLGVFLDHPHLLIPDVNTTNPGAQLCSQFPSGSAIGDKVAPVCAFANTLPINPPFSADISVIRTGVANLRSDVTNLPGTIRTAICNATGLC